MKRILLTMSLVGCIATGYAQTQNMEIRRSDMSYPNADFMFNLDTQVVLNTGFMNSGQNQRWDFSILDTNETYTTKFLIPDANNGGNQVNGCNLVVQGKSTNSEYTYLEVSDSALRILDNTTDTFNTAYNFHPRPLIFPLQYGMAWADSARSDNTYPGSDFGLPVDSLRLVIYIVVNYTCDGQGQLILPLDSVEALRVKQDVYFEYQAFAYTQLTGWIPAQSGSDGELSYSFYAPGGGYYTASVEYKAGQSNTAEISYRSVSLLNVKKPGERQQTQVYPNPAQTHFQIEAKQAGSLQIFDLQGKLVQANVNLEEGTNRVETGELRPGQYVVVILYQDGTSSVNRVVKN